MSVAVPHQYVQPGAARGIGRRQLVSGEIFYEDLQLEAGGDRLDVTDRHPRRLGLQELRSSLRLCGQLQGHGIDVEVIAMKVEQVEHEEIRAHEGVLANS